MMFGRPDDAGPGAATLAAFGLNPSPHSILADGHEVSVRVGSVVLKRTDDAAVATWSQSALHSINPSGWRVPAPLPSNDGRWVVDGWTATRYLDGLHPFSDAPATVADIATDLSLVLADHAAAAAAPLRARTDRWAIADRVAWGEIDATSLPVQPGVLDFVARLTAHVQEDNQPPGIVHGDLAGNVFLHPDGSPVVLDLSPYLRPVRYGPAVVVVDHMLWFNGSPDLRSLVGRDPAILARALVFRVIAHQLALAPGADHGLDEIEPIADALGI